MSVTTRIRLAEDVEEIVREAGDAILKIYATSRQFDSKADGSPVTEADTCAEAIIVKALQKLTPDVPIVAEEAVAAGEKVSTAERFWLVDPLDGTKEFINGNGEFTVNVALVEHGVPVLGVVMAPAKGILYTGVAGKGASYASADGRKAISCRRPPQVGLTVVASRSHGNAIELERFLSRYTVANTRSVGSSLKLCLLATGEADLYPRLGRTMEWDIAAGHAVVVAAGGDVLDLGGRQLRYGKPAFENPHFVAQGWVAEQSEGVV